MSHFCLMVVGDNVEKQLQPFHEFECTGINDEYVKDVDQTDEVRERIEKEGLDDGLDWFGLKERVVTSEEEVDRASKHKYGYAVVRDGVLVKAVDRTNPDKQWDWWVIGGRYAGRLLLKTGGEADTALVGDIDFKAMLARQEQYGREWWEESRKAVGVAPEPDSWDTVAERNLGNTDAAREEYNTQPALVAYRKYAAEHRLMPWLEPEEWRRVYQPIERTLDYYRRRKLSAFAVLKDGQWYERGRMGWFGVVFDEKDEDEWQRQFDALVESLSPETRITMVDCHI